MTLKERIERAKLRMVWLKQRDIENQAKLFASTKYRITKILAITVIILFSIYLIDYLNAGINITDKVVHVNGFTVSRIPSRTTPGVSNTSSSYLVITTEKNGQIQLDDNKYKSPPFSEDEITIEKSIIFHQNKSITTEKGEVFNVSDGIFGTLNLIFILFGMFLSSMFFIVKKWTSANSVSITFVFNVIILLIFLFYF